MGRTRLPENADRHSRKSSFPGKTPTMRCCVYKERAILAERCKDRHGRRQAQPQCYRGYRHRLRRMSRSAATKSRTPAADVLRTVARTYAAAAPLPLTPTTWRTSTRQSARSAAPAPRYARTAPYHNCKRPCETACKVKAISMGTRSRLLHRQQQVHLLRRMRISVPVRSYYRQVLYP